MSDNLNNTNPEEVVSDNITEEFPEKPFNLKKEVFEWFYTIVIALVVAFVIKGFLFDFVKVDGSSMIPTLHHGDMLVVRKIGYTPEQGDIIILDSNYDRRNDYYANLKETTGKEYSAIGKFFNTFTLDKNTLGRKYYVKRIIALPGQTVDIHGGEVYVDGEKLNESYISSKTYMLGNPSSTLSVTVEEDHVFVLGDNRENSSDSRSPSLGQVPFDAIMGEASFRFLPINAIGTL